MKLTGKDGALRIYDSAAILHGAAPLSSLTMDVVKYNGVDTWTNITSDVETDDANVETAFLADNNDVIYLGSTSKFALVKYLLGNGSNYASGSGALIAKYFNGSNFNTDLPGVSDGTASGGDCFAWDGYIGFQIPRDWAIGANAFNANLDSDKYYIALMTTNSSTTDPDADVLAPCDGQYFELKFAGMDFNGPMGRPLTAEELVLNRNRMDSYGHYVKGPDDVIYQPLEIGFSCLIDDTYNKNYIMLALECGNPNTGTWTSVGTNAKGTTKNDGSNDNPAFADSNKKAVNLQVLWTGDNPVGFAYYETYFPPESVNINESEDGIILAVQGGVYGVIEKIYGFGNRY